MTDLLVVLPFCTDDAWRAEKLLDWMRHQNGRMISAPCLLSPARDVHKELIIKTKIAAELAFSDVEIVKPQPYSVTSRAERINELFRQTELHVYQAYKLPFLWLEPDCVTLKKGWLDDVAGAYANQPRRFMGPHLSMKVKNEDVPQLMLARTAVYPANAVHDLDGYCRAAQPFEMVAASTVIPRSTKTRLIQQLVVQHNTPPEAVRKDAVLLHSDKAARLIEMGRATQKSAVAK